MMIYDRVKTGPHFHAGANGAPLGYDIRGGYRWKKIGFLFGAQTLKTAFPSFAFIATGFQTNSINGSTWNTLKLSVQIWTLAIHLTATIARGEATVIPAMEDLLNETPPLADATLEDEVSPSGGTDWVK